MFQVYFQYINNLVMKYFFKYTLNLLLKCIRISDSEAQSRLSKFMHLLSSSEVYFK